MSPRIDRELVQFLEKIIVLTPADLKAKDFDRGFKAGQIEVLNKIKAIYEKQEGR